MEGRTDAARLAASAARPLAREDRRDAAAGIAGFARHTATSRGSTTRAASAGRRCRPSSRGAAERRRSHFQRPTPSTSNANSQQRPLDLGVGSGWALGVGVGSQSRSKSRTGRDRLRPGLLQRFLEPARQGVVARLLRLDRLLEQRFTPAASAARIRAASFSSGLSPRSGSWCETTRPRLTSTTSVDPQHGQVSSSSLFNFAMAVF